VPELYTGTLPDSTTRATSEAASTYSTYHSSIVVANSILHPQTPTTPTTTTTTTTAMTRKGASRRPVNIIEHDDAGPSEDLSDQVEPETIELPRRRALHTRISANFGTPSLLLPLQPMNR
jgi:hypothetical protein